MEDYFRLIGGVIIRIKIDWLTPLIVGVTDWQYTRVDNNNIKISVIAVTFSEYSEGLIINDFHLGCFTCFQPVGLYSYVRMWV